MQYATIPHKALATKNKGNPYLLASILEATKSAPAMPINVPDHRAIIKCFDIILLLFNQTNSYIKAYNF